MVGGKRALGASITSRFPLLTYMYTSHTHTLQTAIMIGRVSRDGWMDPLGRDVKKENETWDGVVPRLGSRIRVVARRTRTE